MQSATRSGIFTSLFLGLLFCVALMPRGAHSFVPTQPITAFGNHNQKVVSLAAAGEDGELDADSAADSTFLPPKPAVKCPDCDLCDGSGRIEGGIGTILKFWPIKAYRPCPQLIENGGMYTRSGQGLDEIAFGRDSKYDPMN
mmetsp:Transcript_11561/g.27567  ORF Transcript_11561/g.27567 Transcript_11561/m.27567 type:complete len:142 (-) Transcript_11561:135-560(-)